MTTKQPESPRTWTLEFMWFKFESDKCERVGRCWRQLIGATHKLRFIRDGLEQVTELDDLPLALEYLHYHFEHYLHVVFASRDRALTALSAVTGQSVEDLRHPGRREAARARLQASAPDAVRAYWQLHQLIDSDVRTRNIDTHDTFLSLVLYNGSDVHYPEDVLLEFDRKPSDRALVAGEIRAALKQAVQARCEQIERVSKAIDAFADTIGYDLKTAQPGAGPNERERGQAS